jgi:nucleoredoxin
LFNMPWPAVRPGDTGLPELNLKKFEGDGSIPCLVLVDDSGKILSNSWVNGTWVGVFPVMQDTEKILPVSSESP